jgi:transposase
MRENLGLSTKSTSPSSLSTDSLDEHIESILENRFSSFVSNQNNFLSRLQEVEAQVKKVPFSNVADVGNLKRDVDRLQKERDQLDARNLELEAADCDLRNDLLMKDEKITHLKEELGKLKGIAPQLNEFMKNQWVVQGNLVCDFQEKEPKILMILDNASYHKRQHILREIERSLPNIQLYFLPAYSPDFNLIELVWHSCKKYIAHHLFQSGEQLHKLLDRLLNEGELIIEWHREIKHKGESLIAS